MVSLKGINGILVEPEDSEPKSNTNGHPVADSCSLEIMHSDTFRVWEKIIKKEDLDGVILTKVSHIVLSIQNALDATSGPRVTLAIREETNNKNLVLELDFPCAIGSRSMKFSLEEVEQDEVTMLKQRVESLTAKLRGLTQYADMEAKLTKEKKKFCTDLDEKFEKEKCKLCAEMDDRFQDFATNLRVEMDQILNQEMLKLLISEKKEIVDDGKKECHAEKNEKSNKNKLRGWKVAKGKRKNQKNVHESEYLTTLGGEDFYLYPE